MRVPMRGISANRVASMAAFTALSLRQSIGTGSSAQRARYDAAPSFFEKTYACSPKWNEEAGLFPACPCYCFAASP